MSEEAEYQYEAKVLDVYDGDSCTLLVDLGFSTYKKEKVRLYGIDTPELRTHSMLEKEMARAARKELRKLIGKDVIIVSHEKGKYGRYLVDIYYDDDQHINKELVDKGLAKEYFGGKRPEWP